MRGFRAHPHKGAPLARSVIAFVKDAAVRCLRRHRMLFDKRVQTSSEGLVPALSWYLCTLSARVSRLATQPWPKQVGARGCGRQGTAIGATMGLGRPRSCANVASGAPAPVLHSQMLAPNVTALPLAQSVFLPRFAIRKAILRPVRQQGRRPQGSGSLIRSIWRPSLSLRQSCERLVSSQRSSAH